MNEENGREGRESIGSARPAEATTATMVEEEPAPEQRGRSRVFTLAQMLVDAGILPADEVSRAQELAATERQPLGRILVRDGLVLSRDLATLTALHLGLPMVDLRSQTLEPEAVSLIPEDAARKNLVLGISREGSHLKVAMTDPTDLQLLQDLSARTGCTIEPVIATQEDIQEHVHRSYRLTQPLVRASTADPSLPAERVTARLLRDALPAQVIDLVAVLTVDQKMDESGVDGHRLVRHQRHQPVLVGDADPAAGGALLDRAFVDQVVVVGFRERAVENAEASGVCRSNGGVLLKTR